MKLTAVQIRYLLAIYRLSKNGIVRSSEIADSLNVSRPSVHRMIDQLMRMNLIVKGKYSAISLTASGREISEQDDEGFRYVSRFLHKYLSLPLNTAEEGALSILSELEPWALKELCLRMNEKLSEYEVV